MLNATLLVNVQASQQSLKQLNSTLTRSLSNVGIQVNSASVVKANSQVQSLISSQQKLKQVQADATKTAKTFSDIVALKGVNFVQYTIATSAVLKFSNVLSGAVRESLRFEKELSVLAQTVNQTNEQVKEYSSSILQISKNYGLAQTKTVELVRVLAQAGLSMRQSLKAADALARTTLIGTFEDLNETTEAFIALMASFKTDVNGASEALDKINIVSKRYAVESSDLVEVIKRSGGAFKAASGGFKTAGNELNELLGLFTSVRSFSRESADTIATAFRTIFARLQRPQTIEFFRNLKIELEDVEGNFIGNMKAIEAISKGLNARGIRSGSIEYAKVVEQIGGIRQISKVIPLLENFSVAQEAVAIANQGSSESTKDVALSQETLIVKIEKLRANFAALITEVSETKNFKLIANTFINMANGAIELSRQLKSLIPLIGAISTYKLSLGLGRYLSGRIKTNPNNLPVTPMTANTGGFVPGIGNKDTVPALLTPGEFVINKKSAKAYGYGQLHKINKYAGGGKVSKQQAVASSDRRAMLSGPVLTSYAEAEMMIQTIVGSLSKEIQEIFKRKFKGLVKFNDLSALGISDSESKVIGLNQNALSSGRIPKIVVAHELGHTLDNLMSIARGGSETSMISSGKATGDTFQSALVKLVRPTMEKQYSDILAGGLYPDPAEAKKKFDYLTSNVELFADFFANATDEGKRILTSTSQVNLGMARLKVHLLKAGKTYAGLSAGDIDPQAIPNAIVDLESELQNLRPKPDLLKLEEVSKKEADLAKTITDAEAAIKKRLSDPEVSKRVRRGIFDYEILGQRDIIDDAKKKLKELQAEKDSLTFKNFRPIPLENLDSLIAESKAKSATYTATRQRKEGEKTSLRSSETIQTIRIQQASKREADLVKTIADAEAAIKRWWRAERLSDPFDYEILGQRDIINSTNPILQQVQSQKASLERGVKRIQKAIAGLESELIAYDQLIEKESKNQSELSSILEQRTKIEKELLVLKRVEAQRQKGIASALATKQRQDAASTPENRSAIGVSSDEYARSKGFADAATMNAALVARGSKQPTTTTSAGLKSQMRQQKAMRSVLSPIAKQTIPPLMLTPPPGATPLLSDLQSKVVDIIKPQIEKAMLQAGKSANDIAVYFANSRRVYEDFYKVSDQQTQQVLDRVKEAKIGIPLLGSQAKKQNKNFLGIFPQGSAEAKISPNELASSLRAATENIRKLNDDNTKSRLNIVRIGKDIAAEQLLISKAEEKRNQALARLQTAQANRQALNPLASILAPLLSGIQNSRRIGIPVRITQQERSQIKQLKDADNEILSAKRQVAGLTSIINRSQDKLPSLYAARSVESETIASREAELKNERFARQSVLSSVSDKEQSREIIQTIENRKKAITSEISSISANIKAIDQSTVAGQQQVAVLNARRIALIKEAKTIKTDIAGFQQTYFAQPGSFAQIDQIATQKAQEKADIEQKRREEEDQRRKQREATRANIENIRKAGPAKRPPKERTPLTDQQKFMISAASVFVASSLQLAKEYDETGKVIKSFKNEIIDATSQIAILVGTLSGFGVDITAGFETFKRSKGSRLNKANIERAAANLVKRSGETIDMQSARNQVRNQVMERFWASRSKNKGRFSMFVEKSSYSLGQRMSSVANGVGMFASKVEAAIGPLLLIATTAFLAGKGLSALAESIFGVEAAEQKRLKAIENGNVEAAIAAAREQSRASENAGIAGAAGGLVAGAALGAGIGAFFGGVTALPGAIVGGLVGLIGGAWNAAWDKFYNASENLEAASRAQAQSVKSSKQINDLLRKRDVLLKEGKQAEISQLEIESAKSIAQASVDLEEALKLAKLTGGEEQKADAEKARELFDDASTKFGEVIQSQTAFIGSQIASGKIPITDEVKNIVFDEQGRKIKDEFDVGKFIQSNKALAEFQYELRSSPQLLKMFRDSLEVAARSAIAERVAKESAIRLYELEQKIIEDRFKAEQNLISSLNRIVASANKVEESFSLLELGLDFTKTLSISSRNNQLSDIKRISDRDQLEKVLNSVSIFEQFKPAIEDVRTAIKRQDIISNPTGVLVKGSQDINQVLNNIERQDLGLSTEESDVQVKDTVSSIIERIIKENFQGVGSEITEIIKKQILDASEGGSISPTEMRKIFEDNLIEPLQSSADMITEAYELQITSINKYAESLNISSEIVSRFTKIISDANSSFAAGQRALFEIRTGVKTDPRQIFADQTASQAELLQSQTAFGDRLAGDSKALSSQIQSLQKKIFDSEKSIKNQNFATMDVVSELQSNKDLLKLFSDALNDNINSLEEFKNASLEIAQAERERVSQMKQELIDNITKPINDQFRKIFASAFAKNILLGRGGLQMLTTQAAMTRTGRRREQFQMDQAAVIQELQNISSNQGPQSQLAKAALDQLAFQQAIFQGQRESMLMFGTPNSFDLQSTLQQIFSGTTQKGFLAEQDFEAASQLLRNAQIEQANILKSSSAIINNEFLLLSEEVSNLTQGFKNLNIEIRQPNKATEDNFAPILGVAQNKSGGGSIFKKRGTDTVPAMLTPGEFVMRKSAVDKIGVSNLEQMNKTGVIYRANGGPVRHPHEDENPIIINSQNQASEVISRMFSQVSDEVRRPMSLAYKGLDVRDLAQGNMTASADPVNFRISLNKKLMETGEIQESVLEHEFGHLADYSMRFLDPNVGYKSSETSGTFQNLLMEKVKPKMRKMYEEMNGGVLKTKFTDKTKKTPYIDYLLKNEELFANLFEDVDDAEIRKILTSTTNASIGMSELKKYLETSKKTFGGLSASDLESEQIDPKSILPNKTASKQALVIPKPKRDYLQEEKERQERLKSAGDRAEESIRLRKERQEKYEKELAEFERGLKEKQFIRDVSTLVNKGMSYLPNIMQQPKTKSIGLPKLLERPSAQTYQDKIRSMSLNDRVKLYYAWQEKAGEDAESDSIRKNKMSELGLSIRGFTSEQVKERKAQGKSGTNFEFVDMFPKPEIKDYYAETMNKFPQQAVAQQAVAQQAVAPQAVAQQVVAPQAVAQQVVAPQAVATETATSKTQANQTQKIQEKYNRLFSRFRYDPFTTQRLMISYQKELQQASQPKEEKPSRARTKRDQYLKRRAAERKVQKAKLSDIASLGKAEEQRVRGPDGIERSISELESSIKPFPRSMRNELGEYIFGDPVAVALWQDEVRYRSGLAGSKNLSIKEKPRSFTDFMDERNRIKQFEQKRDQEMINRTKEELSMTGVTISGRGISTNYASGGLVDTIPAMLSPGEFVMNKKSVDKIGVGNLQRMNKPHGYATGGFVTTKGPKYLQGGGTVENGGSIDFTALFSKFESFNSKFSESVTRLIEMPKIFEISLETVGVNVNLNGAEFLEKLPSVLKAAILENIQLEIGNITNKVKQELAAGN